MSSLPVDSLDTKPQTSSVDVVATQRYDLVDPHRRLLQDDKWELVLRRETDSQRDYLVRAWEDEFSLRRRGKLDGPMSRRVRIDVGEVKHLSQDAYTLADALRRESSRNPPRDLGPDVARGDPGHRRADTRPRHRPITARSHVSACAGGTPVQVHPTTVDLLVNAAPTRVQIRVPRPELGNLLSAFGNSDETTLYGRELVVEVIADDRGPWWSKTWRASRTWREDVYTREENAERHEIQQREWRIGRGESTLVDDRADMQSEAIRSHIERKERGN